MFNKAAILACSRYFLSCLQLYLIETRDIDSIKDVFSADTFVSNISARDTYI